MPDTLGQKVLFALLNNQLLTLNGQESATLRERFSKVFPLCLAASEQLLLEVVNGVLVASVIDTQENKEVVKYTFAHCDLDSLKTLFELTYKEKEG